MASFLTETLIHLTYSPTIKKLRSMMALLKEEHLIVNYIFTLAVYRLAPTLLLYMHVSSRQHTASNYTLIDFKMTVMKRNTNKQC